MTTSSTVAAVVAVVCVVAMGVSATTLESSVGTDPDDVIDLDWERLPIGERAAVELKAEMAENGDSVEAERPVPADERVPRPQSRPDPGRQDERRPGGSVDEPQPMAGMDDSPAGTAPETWDPFRLLAIVALLAALGVVAYRYGGRFLDRWATEENRANPAPWPPREPRSEVDRAWFAMVRCLDVERPWTRTPAEFAAAAVDAGMDPDAVEKVTAAFEAVHYGGASVTPTLRERARSGLRRLDLEPEGEPA